MAAMQKILAELEQPYMDSLLNGVDIGKDDTVLDVGFGAGGFTDILAKRAKIVTPLGIKDFMTGAEAEKHDIVFAAKNPAITKIKKLNSLAKKYAIVIGFADPYMKPPLIDELFKDTSVPSPDGKKPRQPPIPDRRLHYNVSWNLAYDLGAEPNIKIVDAGYTKTFEDEGAAIDYLRRIKHFEDEYLPVFKNNLAPWLIQNADGSVIYRREIKTYVLWWKPVPAEG
ncbi:MAG: hypothetical protein LBU43_11235 [Candidatus Accumulibacter sp.]|nr:hypothetical protein [Accumulibacter sp.]